MEGLNQFRVAKSLKALKPALWKLNRTHFSGISQRVKEEQKLDILQRAILTNPTDQLAREERRVREKWKFLSNAEEKFFRQRSRIKWAHLGDRNTAFFHKIVIARTNKNHIHFLHDQSGRRINESTELKEHAACYFEKILGSTDLPHSPCSIEALEELLSFHCSEVHKHSLARDVTEEEIQTTVFALPLNKCPGPDGYYVEFFRASCCVVGSDVVAAVTPPTRSRPRTDQKHHVYNARSRPTKVPGTHSIAQAIQPQMPVPRESWPKALQPVP
ncbi:PREDICTED: uncharacterized protein LOC104748650 [Camelina sativa]|uniref:Uncharacterized protein LOC104748650 n=1 Tax=Camelina sativa TaxID=90675 RepID=A0ABM0WBD9_CAMSA|nr:PREDICTED: uncharacterized protein LOC104748650 [Camelina sativa]